MLELAIFDSGAVDGTRVWQLGLFISGVPLAAALFLTCVTGWFAAPRRNNAADARSSTPLAFGYLFPPAIAAIYLLTLLLAPARAETGLLRQYAWSMPGLVFGALLFGFPIALRLSRAAADSLSPTTTDAAVLEGATAWQVQRFILWPHFRQHFAQVFATVFWHLVIGFGFILMVGAEHERAASSQLVSTAAGTAYVISLALAGVPGLLIRQRATILQRHL